MELRQHRQHPWGAPHPPAGAVELPDGEELGVAAARPELCLEREPLGPLCLPIQPGFRGFQGVGDAGTTRDSGPTLPKLSVPGVGAGRPSLGPCPDPDLVPWGPLWGLQEIGPQSPPHPQTHPPTARWSADPGVGLPEAARQGQVHAGGRKLRAAGEEAAQLF